MYGATRGMLTTLDDPYTVLVEPQQHQREKEDLQGSFGGIGVTMRRNAQGDLILTPMPDSPAIRTGVLDGDVLIAVDGKPISITMSFDDVAGIVRGPVGSKVTISLRRSGSDSLLSFTITRAVIQTPSVTVRLLDNTPRSATLRSTDLRNAVGMKSSTPFKSCSDKALAGLFSICAIMAAACSLPRLMCRANS